MGKMVTFILLMLSGVFLLSISGCEETEMLTPNHNPEIQSAKLLGNGVEAGRFDTLVCVASDPDDDSLIYTWTAPAGLLAGTGDTVFWLAPDEVSEYPIYCRVEDGQGGYAEANFNIQVFPFNPIEYEWTLYNRDNSGLPMNYLWFVKVTDDDVVWTLDESHDATRFDGSTWQTWDIAAWDDGVGLDVDSEGNAWVTDGTNSIAKIDGSSITRIPHGGGSWLVAVDKQDNIWIGGRGDNGPRISKYDGDSWVHYDSSNTGVPLAYATDMAFDSNNELWFISGFETAGTLTHFDGSRWTMFDAPGQGWPGSIAIDQDDHIWVGTKTGELGVFYQNNWTLVPGPPNAWQVSDIVFSNENDVWCSFLYGSMARADRHTASLFGEAKWSPVLILDSLIQTDEGWITTLDNDSQGNIWFGTFDFNGGLFKMSPLNN